MAGNSTFSVALSKTLDSIGISQQMLQFRKSTILKKELMNVFHEQSDRVKCYMTGSQVEGVTVPTMRSDIDQMRVLKIYSVVNNMQEWRPNQNLLLPISNDVHTGYVKLKTLALQIYKYI